MSVGAGRAAELGASGHKGPFVLLGIGVWLHAADSLVTATIAPSIVEDIGGVTYLNWTISLYQVGAIIAGTAAGVLCARIGIKRMFITASLVYGAGCILGAIAPDMGVLIGARCIQGMGGGMLLSMSYIAIEAWFAPSLWGRLFAFIATIWGGGSLLGPLVGAAFAGPGSWRGAFWVFALQAGALALVAAHYMPAGARTAPRPTNRWPAGPLLVLFAATLLIAETGAVSGPSGNLGAAALGCAVGMALLYVAARLDRRAAVRLLPRQLLDYRHPLGAGLAMLFALAAGTTSFWAYGPLILKVLFGTKPLVSGYILAGEAIAWSLATMAAARVRPSDDQWVIRGGALGVAAGATGFAVAVPTGSFGALVACALIQGAGFGLCWPAIVQRIVRSADPDERSLASGSASTIQRIGYAVGTAAVGIAANTCGLAEGVSPAAARIAAFWVFAAFVPLLAFGVASAWRFTASPPQPAGP